MSVDTAKSNSKQRKLELVYCPMCTHVVEGYVAMHGRKLVVEPDQQCGRCHSALDAGYVIHRNRAA
jgi:hypothetical protein